MNKRLRRTQNYPLRSDFDAALCTLSSARLDLPLLPILYCSLFFSLSLLHSLELVVIAITALLWHWDLIQWFYCIASHQMGTFVFGCSWQLMLPAATWNFPAQPAHSPAPFPPEPPRLQEPHLSSVWLRSCCIWSSLGGFHWLLQCYCLLDQRLNVAFATEQSLAKLMMKLRSSEEVGMEGGVGGVWRANEEGSQSAGNLYFGPTLLPLLVSLHSISMALWKTLLTDFIAFSLPLFAVPATRRQRRRRQLQHFKAVNYPLRGVSNGTTWLASGLWQLLWAR